MPSPLPERRGVVLWGALAAGFLVAQQVTGKATRDAFFLSHHPATALPAVMMAAAVVAVAAALAISRLLAFRSPRQVVPALIGLNAALLLGLFLLALSAPRLAAVLVYLQAAGSTGTLLSGYWSVVGERFDPWTAKHVVSRLALGASLGGVTGGLLAFSVAGAVPVATMLPLTAALNVAALVALVRFGGDAPAVPAGRVRTELSTLEAFRSVPYLRLLAVLVALGAGAEALVDYVLKSRASAALTAGPQLMVFFAAFHTGMGLLALLGQTLFARPALQGLGLAGTVALRPMAVVVAAAVGVADRSLWSAVLGRGSHDVLSNSLFRSGYELLYTPLPEAQKRSTKQIVDVVFDKLGALAGGAAIALALRLFETPERAILVGAGALSLLAAGLTRPLHRGYIVSLEESLRAGKVRLDPEDVVDSTTLFTLAQMHLAAGPVPRTPPTAADPLLRRIAELRSGDATRIRAALGDGEALEVELVPHLVPLLGRNDVYLDALRALRKLGTRVTGQLLDVVLDGETDPVIRRRLPRVLKATTDPRAVEGLVRGLRDPLFSVRAACGAALASLAARAPEGRPSAELVFAAVRGELGGNPGVASAAAAEPPDKDTVLDHVFRLLSLVLDREPLRIAAWAIRGDDPGLRGTALEYMENVLPTEVRGAFLRFVEAPRSDGARSRSELLTDLMRSGKAETGRSRRRALKSRG
jgi:hypothetical protein